MLIKDTTEKIVSSVGGTLVEDLSSHSMNPSKNEDLYRLGVH